jgi:integrase
MKLTDAFLRNLKNTDKAQKLSDGDGLYLYVPSGTGGKLWRMDYRFEGRRKTMSFGAYPALGLKAARAARDAAREKLALGIDPSAAKKQAKETARATALEEARTFDAVAREWLATKREVYAESNTKKKKWIIGLISAHIGHKPVSRIEPGDIMTAVRPVEAAGHVETAHKMAQTAGQICRYARRMGYVTFNAADGLVEDLKPVETRHYATITDPAGIGHLLRCIDEYAGGISVSYALKLLPYLVLRSTELRGARWEEINLETATWIVPAWRRDSKKDGGGMKRRREHIVPLPRQAVALFTSLKMLTGDGALCFPSPHSVSACISDMSLLNGLRRMGFSKDEMTVHGFRAMFSTLINEKKLEWGLDSDIIETQLAHAPNDKVRDAYNHASYLEQRRRMLQTYADYLDELREKAK